MPIGTIKTLRKVSVGIESVKGTAVAGTEQLFASAEIEPDYELKRSETSLGVMVRNSGPTALAKKAVGVRLRSDPNVGVTYEQLAWWLALTLSTPVTTGAGPYVHTFDPGAAGPWNQRAATIRGRWTDGANHEDLRCEYFTGSKLRLRGDMNGALQAELDGFARQMVDEAISGAALPATLTPIMIGECSVFINDSFTLADVHTPAAGQFVGGTMKSFDLDLDVGQFPDWGVQGSLLFAEAKEREKSFTNRFTTLYESNAANVGVAAERVKAATVPQPMRFVTYSFTGPGNMKLRLIVAGKHEDGEIGPPRADADGLDRVDWSILDHYDPTGTKLVKAVITNDDATAL